jgi:hypothetical protein
VVHSFKETLRYYEGFFQSYQLNPPPKEIISQVIREIDSLKRTFDKCYSDIEGSWGKELFTFSEVDSIKNNYFDRENESVELLKKCRNYREIIETVAEPLLKDIVGFSKKTYKASGTPQGNIRQNLIKELEGERGPLRKRLIMESSKIEESRRMVEQELEEMP